MRGAVRAIIGGDCEACPWRGFTDPVVCDVMELSTMLGQDGPPALLLQHDPPHHLWQGLLEYLGYMQAARNAIHRRAAEKQDEEIKRIKAQNQGGHRGGRGHSNPDPHGRGRRRRG